MGVRYQSLLQQDPCEYAVNNTWPFLYYLSGMDQNTSHYRARSFAWSIATDDHQFRRLVDLVFADLQAPPAHHGARFEVLRTGDDGDLTLHHEGQQTVCAAPHMIDRLVGLINEGIIDAATNTIDLHASALTNPATGLTVLATGPSGCGKTTMAANLVRSGWAYLSDEAVGIDLNDGSLVGSGKPLTIKEGLHETLGIDLAPLTIDPAVQRRWYVRPDLIGGSVALTAPPPTDLVFVEFSPQSLATEIEPVAPHYALLRLLSNTFRIERHGANLLPRLAELVAGARAWQLKTCDGAVAAQQLIAAAEVTPRASAEVIHQEAGTQPDLLAGHMPAPSTVFAGFAESGAVVYNHVQRKASSLDPIGALVWRMLDGSTPTAEIANELSEHFDAPATEITADVQALCNDLVAQGLLLTPRTV